MDQLALEDHTCHATKDERERNNQFWTAKRNTAKYTSQVQILPHLPTSQDLSSSSRNNRNSKVLAFDLKKIPHSGRAGRDAMRAEAGQSWLAWKYVQWRESESQFKKIRRIGHQRLQSFSDRRRCQQTTLWERHISLASALNHAHAQSRIHQNF